VGFADFNQRICAAHGRGEHSDWPHVVVLFDFFYLLDDFWYAPAFYV
jgi:hypothetical protein